MIFWLKVKLNCKALKFFCLIFFYGLLGWQNLIFGQSITDSLVLKDLGRDKVFPADSKSLVILSGKSHIQGFLYRTSGSGNHPTLILLHGFPGNEKNLDLAQVVRNHGWNVIYFNYRGSWASQGHFSFDNCVEDVINVVKYCEENADSLRIDINNIALFGHSMGGWVCLKALQKLPYVKKGFALSTWDISSGLTDKKKLDDKIKNAEDLFVLNIKSGWQLYKPVLYNLKDYNLLNDALSLSKKQIFMLDETDKNATIADSIKAQNKVFLTIMFGQEIIHSRVIESL